MSLASEYISTYFLCKGKWITIDRYVLRSKNNPINERYGYCSVCWKNDFKDNPIASSPEAITKEKSFKDSKINPSSGPCGNDTL